jgi:DNA-binding transcriptional LysR family regulator
MADLDVKTLRLFVAVCECGTLARAAARERIEASAISKRIAQLEDDLGVELLVRRRRGVEPTAAGTTLLEHARNVLFTVDRIASDAAAFAGGAGVQGHVRVLATASTVAGALPDDVADFMRQPANRRIVVELEECSSRELVDELRDGRASLGVCRDRVAGDALRSVPYRRDRLVVALHRADPLAARSSLRFVETLDAAHVGVTRATGVHALLERAAAEVERPIAYRALVAGFATALALVGAGLGVAVVPFELARRSAGADVRLVALSDPWAEIGLAVCFAAFESLPAASQRHVEHQQLRGAPAARWPGA